MSRVPGFLLVAGAEETDLLFSELTKIYRFDWWYAENEAGYWKLRNSVVLEVAEILEKMGFSR